jgi:hypothetical protein
LMAYSNDVAEASGLQRVAGSTIQMLRYGATIVPGPAFDYLTHSMMPGAGLAIGIGAPTSGVFLASLGAKLKTTWRPLVFGNYLKRRVANR